jgi:hypothetical protein
MGPDLCAARVKADPTPANMLRRGRVQQLQKREKAMVVPIHIALSNSNDS